MFALIVEDFDPAGNVAQLVRELFDTNPEFHPDLLVIDATSYANVAIGWVYDPNTKGLAAYAALTLTVEQLEAYIPQAQLKALTAGKTVNVATSGAAVPILCDGTSATRSDLAMLALNGQSNPSSTKTWLDNNGATTKLSGPEFVTLATLIGNWIDDTYAAIPTIVAEIAATPPTITSYAEIDATFAAVS
jgi:hypothetical protein